MWALRVCRSRVLLVVACLAIGNRAIVRADVVAAPWTAQDVGSPLPAGSSTFDPNANTFTISAGGAIGGASDQFQFVYQQITGDVEIVARVDSLIDVNPWTKAGVMIRATLDPASPHAYALVSAENGAAFQRRLQAGGTTARSTDAGVAAPSWVRLVKAGGSVTAYRSADGTTWTRMGSATVALGDTAYVGLAVASSNATTSTTAALSQVTILPLSLPAGQQQMDIGAPALAGSGTFRLGTYQITASGADIGGTSDQFHFVYQPVTGDLDIEARVASLKKVNNKTKAGVMIRQTLTTDSPHAFALVTSGSGLAFERRLAAGGATVNTAGAAGTAPQWVRLKRTGSTIESFSSADGQTWTSMGSDTIAMTDTVYVGLAVTSHSATAATTASIDGLTVQVPANQNQPPTVTLTAPANGGTFTAPATITLTATASDPEGRLAHVDFFNGTTLLGSTTTAPYSATWANVPAGTYSVSAAAYDADGGSASSAVATVTVSAAPPPPPPTPTGVAFHESADNDTMVTSYRFDVFASGADPATATPVASSDLGKPAADANGDITLDLSSFFSSLAPGSYVATVSAVGDGGSSQSASVAFAR